MPKALSARAALRLVRHHGIMLEAARGRRPNLVAAMIGEHCGSWWSHPLAHRVFAITRAVRESPEVLVCRLLDGKITYVHRRLWPALVRLADRMPPSALTKIHEIHTPSGKHVIEETPFPAWVPRAVLGEAQGVREADAFAAVGDLGYARTRSRARHLSRTAGTQGRDESRRKD